jgi:ParB/RepB/Spo0J family partition protein
VSAQPFARRKLEIALDRIDLGGNVRELDAEHVSALARSMAVRGLIVPVVVRSLDGERFALVAGEHRLAAAREVGWSTIAAVISDHAEGASGDQGAENVLRKSLTPLEEARAVEKMLADGYSVDGAATVLGWHKRRVTRANGSSSCQRGRRRSSAAARSRSQGSTRCWRSRPSRRSWARWSPT